ncbi:Membrane dipeptidase (fragment) [Candidatus Sulfopaludibacter sp. SbA4]
MKSGKIAAILTIEGGHQIDNGLAVLRMYYRRGIRSMTLTHFRNTDWADSPTGQPAHNGLTDFGRDVVREMNRLGMLVDVSHVSDKTFYDVLAVSSKPVIATHSSCRALSDVPRNMTDDMIRALAKNGGVMGINFGEGFLSPKDAELLKAAVANISYHEPSLTGTALDAYAAEEFHKDMAAKLSNATIDDAVEHIQHVIEIAGFTSASAAISTASRPCPKDWKTSPGCPLSQRSCVTKVTTTSSFAVFGGNTLRVMREVMGK